MKTATYGVALRSSRIQREIQSHMRSLQRSLFLGLFAMTLASGCTITTTEGNISDGGDGGADVGAGGTKATTTAPNGGTGAVAGAAAGGTSAATTAAPSFTAADCAASAAAVPAAYPDITPACIACVYGANSCTDAVTCHNTDSCLPQTLKALECIRLFWLVNEAFASEDDVQSCQDTTSTGVPAGSTVVPLSTDPNAWKGATVVPSDSVASIQLNILTNCAVECNAANP
jgi:hypothetical protein